MFSKFALFVVSAVALLAAAAPGGSPPTGSQCNSGPVMCCGTVNNSNVAARFEEAGIDARSVQAGYSCGPGSGLVSVGGGTTCTSAPMCCENNNSGGLISITCTPISVGL